MILNSSLSFLEALLAYNKLGISSWFVMGYRMRTPHDKKLPYTILSVLVIAIIIVVWSVVHTWTRVPYLTVLISLGLTGVFFAVLFVHLWHSRQGASRTFQHYKMRLVTTQSLGAKQQLLEHMLALNLLSDVDLSGIDFADINLINANLIDTDLTASKQTSINLNNADLSRTNLSFSNLRYAMLRDTRLRGANLYGATLNSSDMSGSNLQNANLRAASLDDVDLRCANLRGADLSYANLQNANLAGAILINANLNHCILPDGSVWQPDSDLSRFIHDRQLPRDDLFNPLDNRAKTIPDSIQEESLPKRPFGKGME